MKDAITLPVLETVSPAPNKSDLVIYYDTQRKTVDLAVPVLLEDTKKMPVYTQTLEQFIGFAWKAPGSAKTELSCDWCGTTEKHGERWAVMRDLIEEYVHEESQYPWVDAPDEIGSKIALCPECYEKLHSNVQHTIRNNTEVILANEV